MKLRSGSYQALALVMASSSALFGGCGGSTSSHSTLRLPADESALLEFAPTDAFFVARLDIRELRASSSWELVAARLETAREEDRVIANGTDRVYVAIGGLIDAPTPPPVTNEEGEYRPQPAWVPIAEGLQGRIPTGVVVIEGSVASLCRAVIDGSERTGDSHGLHYGVKDGVVLATRGESFCMLTYEPAFEYLLAHAGPTSSAARRLMAVARGGSLGTASMAFELDSPSFRRIIDTIGPPPDREPTSSSNWAEITRGIVRIVLDGITATEWEVRSDAGGFESIARVQVSNHDRGVMWREFSSMYMQIANVVISNIESDSPNRENVRRILDSVRFEALDDGYIVRNEISADLIARIFAELPPAGDAPDVAVTVSSDVYQLPYSLDGEATATIALVEPHLAELSTLEPRGRADVLVELSRSYRFVGRFDDARTILTTNAGDAINVGTIASPSLYAELCALELELGRGAEAKRAAGAGREGCTEGVYCEGVFAELVACDAVATAAVGDTSGALALLPRSAEPQDDEAGVRFGLARARVLVRAGRLADAAAIVESLCIGRSRVDACRDASFVDAMILARTAATVAAMEDGLSLLESRADGFSSTRRSQESNLTFASLRCDGSSRLAAADESTASSCSSLYAGIVEVYGATHPRTLVAAMGLVRSARARRDTATVTSTLAAIDVILAALGPNAPERADRAALGGNTGRRQTR